VGYSIVDIAAIEGSGPGVARIYIVDGERIPMHPGTCPRFDPDVMRQIVAGPDGVTMLAVGARRGGYEPRGRF
jgi:hypothetical protein